MQNIQVCLTPSSWSRGTASFASFNTGMLAEPFFFSFRVFFEITLVYTIETQRHLPIPSVFLSSGPLGPREFFMTAKMPFILLDLNLVLPLRTCSMSETRTRTGQSVS